MDGHGKDVHLVVIRQGDRRHRFARLQADRRVIDADGMVANGVSTGGVPVGRRHRNFVPRDGQIGVPVGEGQRKRLRRPVGVGDGARAALRAERPRAE